MKYDYLPQVLLLKSASLRSEDYKFENERKSVGVLKSEFIRPL